MTFKHKLSVRLALLKDALARVWPQLLAFWLPQLPQFVHSHRLLEGTCLALLVALCRALRRWLDFTWWSLESGDRRRRCHIALPNGRRARPASVPARPRAGHAVDGPRDAPPVHKIP